MSEEPDKKETVEMPEKTQKCHDHHENNLASKVFWGLLLILIGGLALAGNFGLVTVEWTGLWRLWPLFIIAAGLSILSFKNIIWKIISVILSVATVAAIAWVMLGGYGQLSIGSAQNYDTTVQVASSEIKSAEINLDAGASDIDISTASQTAVAVANFTSNLASLEKTSSVSGTVQKINFSMKSGNIWLGSFKNQWDIKLTRDLPISLSVDAGACDADIDLSSAKLNAVNINMGASSLTLRLGENQSLANVNIDSGASSIKVQVPNGVGVKLYLDDGLNSKELADLEKTGEKTYESSGYNSSAKKIDITANIGVSSFTIERY